MINNRIFGPVAGELKMLGFGQAAGNAPPIRTDDAGRAPIAAVGMQTITAVGLDIRSLSAVTDSALITASNLDIRSLSGTQDSMELYSRATAEDSESGSIVALGSRIFLTKDIGAYSAVTYLVINTGGVAVTVALQIAPVDSISYYVTDGSTFNLLSNNKLLLSPSQPTRFTRIRLSALLLASATVYFFAQA